MECLKMGELSAFLIVWTAKKVTKKNIAPKSGELERRIQVLQSIICLTKLLSPNANKPGRNFEAIKMPANFSREKYWKILTRD